MDQYFVADSKGLKSRIFKINLNSVSGSASTKECGYCVEIMTRGERIGSALGLDLKSVQIESQNR